MTTPCYLWMSPLILPIDILPKLSTKKFTEFKSFRVSHPDTLIQISEWEGGDRVVESMAYCNPDTQGLRIQKWGWLRIIGWVPRLERIWMVRLINYFSDDFFIWPWSMSGKIAHNCLCSLENTFTCIMAWRLEGTGLSEWRELFLSNIHLLLEMLA